MESRFNRKRRTCGARGGGEKSTPLLNEGKKSNVPESSHLRFGGAEEEGATIVHQRMTSFFPSRGEERRGRSTVSRGEDAAAEPDSPEPETCSQKNNTSLKGKSPEPAVS